MPIYEFEGLVPVVDPSAYVHPTAVLIGDAIVGPDCYVGPFACMRGDFGRLILKAGANLQDHCLMHGYVDMDTVVEEDGHIGHGAILHSCIVGRNTLVGMNAVVMDGAVLGPDSIVAANSLVKAGFRGAPRQLLVGSPASVRREVTAEEVAWMALNTREYQELAARSRRGMHPAEALPAAEANRPRLRGATDVVAIHAKAGR
ncbi:carnitine operon protein CaiE [Paracoccus sp. (in: a-proteobacteria)]|uniref:carnitine operon protein CaiE n=1 Tax=Paracoccus sp. TaxID=267 RepID=UPI00321FC2AE